MMFSRLIFSFSAIFFATGVMLTDFSFSFICPDDSSSFFTSTSSISDSLLGADPESSIVPRISPTLTTSPTVFLTSLIVPLEGETISRLTLSVSSSIITSPLETISPSFFNHEATVASTVDSANSGL